MGRTAHNQAVMPSILTNIEVGIDAERNIPKRLIALELPSIDMPIRARYYGRCDGPVDDGIIARELTG